MSLGRTVGLGMFMAFITASSAFATDTHTFTYRVQVPSSGGDCAQLASDMATRFGTASGLDQTQGSCQGVRSFIEGAASFDVATIILTYQAEYELQPSRAIFGGSEFLGVPSAQTPLFDSYADCLAQLQKALPEFETQTGALAIAAHCDSADGAMGSGYSLTVETFGTVKRQLFAFIPDFGLSQAPADGSKVISSAVQALSSAGAYVAYSDAAHVFFYADTNLTVLDAYFASFSTASECTDQVQDANAIYTAAGIDSVISFCEPEGGDRVSLTTIGIGEDVTTRSTTTDVYSTYTECRSDRDRAVANEVSAGRTVLGSVCVPSLSADGSGYELDIYENL